IRLLPDRDFDHVLAAEAELGDVLHLVVLHRPGVRATGRNRRQGHPQSDLPRHASSLPLASADVTRGRFSTLHASASQAGSAAPFALFAAPGPAGRTGALAPRPCRQWRGVPLQGTALPTSGASPLWT